MIDILITSKDAARLSQVVHVLGECGDYRTTRAADSPSLLVERGDSLDAFDVLIVDATSIQDAELPVVAQLCQKHKHLSCILLTPDASPETLIAAMRAGFRDVLNWPLERRALGDALVRLEAQRLKTNTHTTEIVSFMSCKGGVGTSFIAANVAETIASARQKRVLMIDLNQLFADAAFLVTGETPPSTLPQLCSQIDRMDMAFFDASVLHVSDTFHILAGAGDPVKAAEIKEDRLEWILGVAAPRYDFVIFDLGQTINPISMLALDRSDQIHIVLQATMPHVRAGRRLQEILGSLGYAADRTRLLLNRYSRHEERARAAHGTGARHAPLPGHSGRRRGRVRSHQPGRADLEDRPQERRVAQLADAGGQHRRPRFDGRVGTAEARFAVRANARPSAGAET